MAVVMNADAEAFFAANPAEPYWYYSAGLRVPNPVLRRKPDWVPAPWPAVVVLGPRS